MKHDYQIIEAFNQSFQPKEEAVTQEQIDEACKAVQEKAAEQFGPEGIYVSGKMNHDFGGVSFRYKRPSIRQRVEHFIACQLPELPQDDPEDDEGEDDSSNDDNSNAGLTDERLSRLIEIANVLDDQDFTDDDKPSVDALNNMLEEGEEKFTAEERDELWKRVPE